MSSVEQPEARRWGPHLLTRILLGIPPLAAVVVSLIVPEFWPAVPFTLAPFIVAMRIEVRLTAEELLLRHLIGSTRIPRQDVAFARFDYKPLGVFLEIHRRDGGVALIRFAPKLTSSELSGDPPPPDSLAFQITRWAETGELPADR
jgi:hypothetical protein